MEEGRSFSSHAEDIHHGCILIMDVDIELQHIERASPAQQRVACTLCLVAYLGMWTSAVMKDRLAVASKEVKKSRNQEMILIN